MRLEQWSESGELRAVTIVFAVFASSQISMIESCCARPGLGLPVVSLRETPADTNSHNDRNLSKQRIKKNFIQVWPDFVPYNKSRTTKKAKHGTEKCQSLTSGKFLSVPFSSFVFYLHQNIDASCYFKTKQSVEMTLEMEILETLEYFPISM